jgi:radical SAM protein (TIGR01212 family)
LALLAAFPSDEIWLELGLQSAHDATLDRINRGHGVEAFSLTCRSAAQAGLKICAHVIAGLPGETPTHFLRTIDFLNGLPISGIKLHNLYVCQNTALADQWLQGLYQPLERDEYLHCWLIPALKLLRPDIVIQRLTGDPGPGELLAPLWCSDKSAFLKTLHAALEAGNVRQGAEWVAPLA